MGKSLPILLNHGHEKPIGKATWESGRLRVFISQDFKLTEEMLFKVFGGPGFLIEKQHFENGIRIIEEFTILEFSVSI